MKIDHMRLVYSAIGCTGAVLLMACGSGCVTSTLAKHTESYEWRPESVRKLCWVSSTNQTRDVAVLFDQFRTGQSDRCTRQAVWYPGRPSEPLLVNSNAVRSLTATWRAPRIIPLFTNAASVPPTQSTCPPGYALLGETGTTFTLHADGHPAGPYKLPATQVKARTGLLLAGLPFALAADAAIVVVAVYSFFEGAGAFPSGGCN